MTLHVILRLHYHLMCCLGARKQVLELEKYFGVKKVMKKLRKKIIMKKKMCGQHGVRSRDPRHSKQVCYHYSMEAALQTPEIAPFIKCCLLCTQYTLSFFLSLHVIVFVVFAESPIYFGL